MAIKVGDSIPSAVLKRKGPNGIEDVDMAQFAAGKTVVVFSVPGAFTPTCSAKHLPGFVNHAAEFKAKGVDSIVCMSVNDAFVMDAWAKDQKAGDHVMLLADGNAEFAKKLGLEFDASAYGMGIRGQRFAMVVKDGKVTHLAVEKPGAFEVSSAEAVLKAL